MKKISTRTAVTSKAGAAAVAALPAIAALAAIAAITYGLSDNPLEAFAQVLALFGS